MIRHTRRHLEFFSFTNLDACREVTSFVTTRVGGVSAGNITGLNLGMRCGDDPDSVIDNRAQLSLVTGAFPELLTFGRQVHGSRVEVVTGDHIGSGSLNAETAIPDTDAMITRIADVPLVVLVADCVAVVLFDPASGAVGVAHAGWRGTVAGIARSTVRAMSENFGSKPDGMLAGIGPSIGPCCFEVGGEVVARFKEAFPDAWRGLVSSPSSPGGSKARIDLWKANAIQLADAGLRETNVETARLCTSCRTDLFYSHRRESTAGPDGGSGRFAALIMRNGRTRRPW